MGDSLVSLFNQYGRAKYLTDKGDSHSYFEVYDELFKPFQDIECNVFECGFQSGGCLKLFDDYFSKARIIGIDKEIEYVRHAPNNKYSKRVEVFKYDLYDLDEAFFSSKNFMPDIAIDDSTHYLKDQILFIETMYPLLNAGGILVVEDILYPKTVEDEFKKLNIPFELVDMSHLRNLNDNALLIYRK